MQQEWHLKSICANCNTRNAATLLSAFCTPQIVPVWQMRQNSISFCSRSAKMVIGRLYDGRGRKMVLNVLILLPPTFNKCIRTWWSSLSNSIYYKCIDRMSGYFFNRVHASFHHMCQSVQWDQEIVSRILNCIFFLRYWWSYCKSRQSGYKRPTRPHHLPPFTMLRERRKVKGYRTNEVSDIWLLVVDCVFQILAL